MGLKSTYNEIIAFAIDKEREAVDLYADLCNRAQSPSGKILFKELADMERGHKARLENLDIAYFASRELRQPEDLKISDYLVNVELTPHASYQDILLFAAKREKAAFDLYTDLGRIYTTIPQIKQIFDVLAQEEAYHKLKLEREYDEVVYKED
jgi:rubrerythrin